MRSTATDGEQRGTTEQAPGAAAPARERILQSALRLFAEKGYANTPVRDIANAARVNVAALAYYFGDKAGLYRAALYEPLQQQPGAFPAFDAPGLTLRQSLRLYIQGHLQPLRQGESAHLAARLRLRETFEPTGMLEQENSRIADRHRRLLGLLMHHLELAGADDELHALAFSMFGLVASPYFGRDYIRSVHPALLDAPQAADQWIERLTAYAVGMFAAEANRREAPPA